MNDSTPSRRTLDQVPARALTFLSTVGRSKTIRAALGRFGYDAAAHDEGWRRLHAAAGYRPTPTTEDRDVNVVDAIAWLDAWDNRWFPVAEVSLRFSHPAAHAAVFAGDLKAAEGPASLLAVRTFLDRIEALEDRGVLATLARRGLGADALAEARAQLGRAESAAEVAAVAEREVPDEGARVALWAWLTEWSTIARAAIDRRDYLIRLGLARRRRRDAPDAVTVTEDGVDEPSPGETP